jgi:hypothetical protein
VARSLHVRLDEVFAAALDIVRAGGMTDSEAVRTALREAAARRRVRSAIREEVRLAAADERDREEMRLIREQLAELAPPPADWRGGRRALPPAGVPQRPRARATRSSLRGSLSGRRVPRSEQCPRRTHLDKRPAAALRDCCKGKSPRYAGASVKRRIRDSNTPANRRFLRSEGARRGAPGDPGAASKAAAVKLKL